MDKRLIIAGSAHCLWDDLHKVRKIRKAGADVMVLNATGLYFPDEFQHWASLHRELFKKFRKKCKKEYMTHCNRQAPGVDKVWNIEGWGSDSGLFACRVGLGLGYDEIILCGIPLDEGPHFYDPIGAKCSFDTTHLHGLWASDARDHFDNKIRSVSGYTRELLGSPKLEE